MTKKKVLTEAQNPALRKGAVSKSFFGGWINAEKKFPEIGHDEEYPHASEMILLSDGEFVYYGQFENSPDFGQSFIDANGDAFDDDGIEITHWMSLPEPPKNVC